MLGLAEDGANQLPAAGLGVLDVVRLVQYHSLGGGQTGRKRARNVPSQSGTASGLEGRRHGRGRSPPLMTIITEDTSVRRSRRARGLPRLGGISKRSAGSALPGAWPSEWRPPPGPRP